jgi:SAM-dependent methyltransferase
MPNEVSWTQEKPKTSLDFIRETQLGKSAKIIDIGGGDSKLVDYLLEEGYENITVLDISTKALERAKVRLAEKANKVHWIVSDINDFKPDSPYDIWHDRATFHFLTTNDQINNYFKTAQKWIRGFLIIGTFSDKGPLKCSGLEIKQYTETTLEHQFHVAFEKLKCINEDHKTPFETMQNFIFCVFKKR